MTKAKKGEKVVPIARAKGFQPRVVKSSAAQQQADELPDEEAPAAPLSKDLLQSISKTAAAQVAAEEAVADAEAKLKEAKARLETISKQTLPALMRQAGMSEFKLDDGTKITVKEDFHCGISEERAPLAFEWLRRNNFDGILKTKLGIEFQKGQDAVAIKLAETLIKKGLPADLKSSVHPQTLKSFIKEQREKGASPPEDIFGIMPYDVAKVQLPKK